MSEICKHCGMPLRKTVWPNEWVHTEDDKYGLCDQKMMPWWRRKPWPIYAEPIGTEVSQ